MAIEVLEWQDESGQEMVWRHPGGELKLGAQLVVSENQWAIFFRDGRALDTFATGRHTLTTANLPLLARVIGLPFGGKSPFRADVYFVARKVFADLKWGTKDPVAFRDAELSMVRLRAHGVFAVRVTDAQVFVNTLVGSQGRYTTDEIEEPLPPNSSAVTRGGAWHVDAKGLRVSNRVDVPRDYADYDTGFRCAIDDR